MRLAKLAKGVARRTGMSIYSKVGLGWVRLQRPRSLKGSHWSNSRAVTNNSWVVRFNTFPGVTVPKRTTHELLSTYAERAGQQARLTFATNVQRLRYNPKASLLPLTAILTHHESFRLHIFGFSLDCFPNCRWCTREL